MKTLTFEKLLDVVRITLKDFGIVDIDKKFKNELKDIHFLFNDIWAYHNTWESEHVYSLLPKQAMASKNIDNFLSSQLKHIDETMKFCTFQFALTNVYYDLMGVSLGLRLLLADKKAFTDLLYNLHMRFWTDLEAFHNPFELIRQYMLDIFHFDIKNNFTETVHEDSYIQTNFASSFLNMYSFLHAFNITEKRIKISFSIHLYQVLCKLSLSKYKTKEVTDTILHHLDIDATINLRKINQVKCIGILFHTSQIYGYEDPIIPIKLLDRQKIYQLQNQHIQTAIENNNEALAREWNDIQVSMGLEYRVYKSR